MKRLRLAPPVFSALMLALTASAGSLADEGMWRPAQLASLAPRLQKLGLETDPASLGDLTGFPLGAVISLGGCTASFVSPDGLVVTNHHCAYQAIQYNSTESRNLLETGFLAARPSEELPARPGARILVTVDVRDVSAAIRAAVPDTAVGYARWEAIAAKEKELVTACERDAGHRCRIAAYHGGLEYELVKQLEIRDVRLVHAPARSVGIYGGEIDNWMWPRHTGDYAFYRAWVGPDGEPADYGAENVPYTPRHHLRIAREPLAEGDFVLAAGYPGSTNRYRLAVEVEESFGWYYPTRIARLQTWYDVIARETAASEDLEIRYASLVRGLENSLKNHEGMLDGFARSGLLESQRSLEAALEAWIEADAERRAAYRWVLEELHRLIELERSRRERKMTYEYLVWRGELARTARTLYRLATERAKPDAEREQGYQERDERKIRERLVRVDRTFAASVDRAVWARFLLDYAAMPADQRVEAFDEFMGLAGDELDESALEERLRVMYETTTLADSEARLAWLDATAAEIEASDDPFLRLAVATHASTLEIEAENKDLEGRLEAARSRYMEALVDFLGDRRAQVYPDANGTLRATFGRVAGYSPRDAVVLEPFTTLQGIVEKDTGTEPFDAPPDQLAAIAADVGTELHDPLLQTVPVNFLSDLDSTGGNSGSPTLNARGELVGLLFDGVWESIIADWDFVPERSRTIHVDMRYVVWMMRYVDGAGNLLEEMGIAP